MFAIKLPSVSSAISREGWSGETTWNSTPRVSVCRRVATDDGERIYAAVAGVLRDALVHRRELTREAGAERRTCHVVGQTDVMNGSRGRDPYQCSRVMRGL